MLKLNISAICNARGVQYPFVYLQKIGIPRHSARKMLNGEHTHINFRYLAILCKALLCTPNDLILYLPEKNEQLAENHPLQELKNQASDFNWLQNTGNIPFDDLQQIIQQIKLQINKTDTPNT